MNKQNKERKQIKIYFVDYSEQFDEWRDGGVTNDFERDFMLSLASFGKDASSRRRIFRRQEQYFSYGQLYNQTKLWSGRRDYPEVRVEINVEPSLVDFPK